jgi:hypothetical protein
LNESIPGGDPTDRPQAVLLHELISKRLTSNPGVSFFISDWGLQISDFFQFPIGFPSGQNPNSSLK